ncbi:nb-arc and tpr domain protein [Colletotrichum incanum]|uniref:Nb-arc and tpr domain protein n=1 Tax=Colletotrichum incanum TaxID=1573173 RepID=A0A166ZY30_COLIC|nr:nb-arc and tpr domain protein [Colletotrichum incanum]
MTKKLSRDEYKVAWICPLEVEQIAAMEMLDEEHEALPQSAADHNVYNLGSINGHNVVIAGLHQPGNCPAATVVTQMRMTFPNLRFGLLVGIGGGVPVQTDDGMIRLGHVVVSKPAGGHSGAVQYDHGKARDGQFQRTGALAPPPAVLLNAAQALAVRRARIANDPVQLNIRRINTSLRNLRRFRFPGVSNDHLYLPHYRHLQLGTSCDQGGCDLSQRIQWADADDDTFVVVHRGTIASGELVVKTAELRDRLAQQHGLLCFEMEAAGALTDFPCMVIRGISDYCDSHKNDQWHGYAAAVAAAYARQLFFHMPVEEVQRRTANEAQSGSASFALPFKLPQVKSVNNFVARQEELVRLHEALTWTGERRTAVLHGLGGIGKTQTTIEYAKRHRDNYSAVIWLDARDTTALKQSYQRVAQRIARETKSVVYIQNAINSRDLDEMVEAVKRWLDEPENNRWLVIYDNYDDVRFDNRDSLDEDAQCVMADNENDAGGIGSKAYDIRSSFPETQHGAILITTRASSVRLGHSIRLQKLSEVKDCVAILASMSGRDNFDQDPGATLLAQKLDGLPLALATAGAYLNQVTTSCTEYVQMYEKTWLRLQKRSPHLLEYDRALCSTWNVSLQQIQLQNQQAAELLRLWAYFDNYDLWYELLQAGGPEEPLWIHEMTEDKISFDAAMRVLCEHGLAEPNAPGQEPGSESRGYSMHGCVHAWTVHVLNEKQAKYWQGPRQDKYWIVQRRLLQHADRCVANIERGVELEHNAWMLHRLGNLYSDQGQLKKAEAMYERALQGYEKALGPEHTLTLSTVNNLGNLYSDKGRLREAEAMYKRALQGYEKALGPEHTLTLSTVNNLGLLYKSRGRLNKAEAMFERALQGKEKALGPEHTSTLNSIHSLGLLYSDQGRLEEAEAIYKRAL